MKPKFICVQPDDDYYIWQVQLWLESLKKLNKSEQAIVVVFTPQNRKFNAKWLNLPGLYPEAEFKFIEDTDGISKLLQLYIPLLRPYCLMKFFKERPELANEVIFYCDSDVLFTENFNVDKYIEDEVCYLSNTVHYVGASYFDSKVKDVLPEKLEDYKKRDILEELCQLVGVSREIAVNNNLHSGGAQYLLKSVDGNFWEKVLTDCIKIKLHLNEVNKEFFQNENKGFQSWCTDMFALLWNLWFFKKEVKVIPEMDFAWSTDSIDKIKTVGIFHNAGIASENTHGTPTFYKGKYHRGLNPYTDPHLETVYNDENSKKLANWYYVSKLIEIKEKHVNIC
jgi:hypothetical protein